LLDWTAVEELSTSFHVEQAHHPRKNDVVRASSIGECRRKLAYRILWWREGIPEPPMDSHLLSIFDLGHALHLQLQTRLSNPGPLKWIDADLVFDAGRPKWTGNCEIRLEDPDLFVAGHCDGLSRPLKRVQFEEYERLVPTEPDDPAGLRYIIDIKTITARDRIEPVWDMRTGQFLIMKEPPSPFARLEKAKDEHIAQTSIYAHLTTRPNFKTDRLDGPLPKLPHLMVIYLAKDVAPDWYGRYPALYPEPRGLLNSPYKVFTQPASPTLIAALLKKVALVRDHLAEGRLPARDYHHSPQKPDWHCTDCPFRHTCYADEGYFADDRRPVPTRITDALLQVESHEKKEW
jgi:hypothetical protein